MKSCENCKCGYWQMRGYGYGRYPEVACYLHENCCGDEPYRIYEDEWVKSAESCPHYEDEQTQAETHRIAEEYKEELMGQWEEVQKKKTVMAQKDLIKLWFDHIAQMADNRKTLNGDVMDDAHCLDEIRALAVNASEFVEKHWDNEEAWKE